MKKWIALAIVMALAGLIDRFRSSRATDTFEQGLSIQTPATNVDQAPVEPKAQDSVAPPVAQQSPSPSDTSLLDLAIVHQLKPQDIEKWTTTHNMELIKQVHGHPKSGERLEMTWGSTPQTTAVFDIMGVHRYQLSALRSQYPAETPISSLKRMLKAKVSRPVASENESSLVFDSDDQGLIVWMSQNSDGSFKVAAEYGAPSHSPGPY